MKTTSALSAAAFSTRLLVSAKIRTVRSTSSRVWMAAGLAIACLTVLFASNSGTVLLAVASGGAAEETSTIFARGLLVDWVSDDFTSLATMVLLGSLAAAIVAPLTSAAPPELFPTSQRVGMRLASMTPYLEATLVSCISLVTLSQLLGLTVLASMATIDGPGRAVALLLAWTTWLALIALSQVCLWSGQRWRARRTAEGTSAKTSITIPAVALAVVAVLVATTWTHAQSLWGLSSLYLSALRGQTHPAVSLVVVLLAAAALARTGWAMAAHASAHQRPTSVTALFVRSPITGGPFTALLRVMLRSVVRMRVIRGPLLTLTALAAVIAAVAGPTENVMWGIALGVPLTCSLAFTRNAVAVLGPGNLWLSSLPSGLDRLPWVIAATGAATSIVLGLLPWVVPALAGALSLNDAASIISTTVAAATLMTATSTWYAIRHPVPVPAQSGESLLSAGATITSTLRLLVGPGLLSWLATSGSSVLRDVEQDVSVGWLAVSMLACVALSACLMTLAGSSWSRPTNRSMALVGAL